MLSMVFPGQGSQFVGMLAELAQQHPAVQATFAEASNVLGYDLWALAQEGPVEALDTTERTQPIMLAAGVAVFRAWQAQQGMLPAIVAGHSLGEYTAWVIAGALSFADAIQLVALRGRFMQEAVPVGEGAMGAIVGLDSLKVQQICEEAAEGEVLSPANMNSPQQIVIAGTLSAVGRGLALAKAQGAKIAKQLPMSVPSHCALMSSAAEKLSLALTDIEIKTPSIPVINNADVSELNDPDAIRSVLSRQLTQPVRWVETIAEIEKRGSTVCLEVGPGNVLSGLNKRMSTMRCASIQTPEGLAEEVCHFKIKS